MFCSVATHHGGYFFISFRIYEYITKHALQSQAFFWGVNVVFCAFLLKNIFRCVEQFNFEPFFVFFVGNFNR